MDLLVNHWVPPDLGKIVSYLVGDCTFGHIVFDRVRTAYDVVIGVALHHARAVPVHVVAFTTYVGNDATGRSPGAGPDTITQDLPGILFPPLLVAQGRVEVLSVSVIVAYLVYNPRTLAHIHVEIVSAIDTAHASIFLWEKASRYWCFLARKVSRWIQRLHHLSPRCRSAQDR